MDIKWIGAHENNFSKGRGNYSVKLICLHWIVGNLASADKTFQDPNRKASAHYGIEGNSIHQYVNEKDTAWHAGNFLINQKSIGIEHSGGELVDGTRRKPSPQTHETSAQLIADICKRYNIKPSEETIIPHRAIKPTQCPGTLDVSWLISRVNDIMESAVDTYLPVLLKDQLGIDINASEGDVRGRVGEIKDKLNSYESLRKQVEKLEKENIFLEGETGRLEREFQALSESRDRLTKELEEVKRTLSNRDAELADLNKRVETLEKNMDPETKVIIDKEEYDRLQKKRVLDRATDLELIKEFIVRQFKKLKGVFSR